MFLRCPWVPALLIWQQLSFLVLAAPIPERHWVPPTTKPELSPEPWSLPNGRPELPDALTRHLQPEGFDDLESSAPSWTTQEAAAQPPELPNELIPQPPELQEKTVSPLGDEQVQPPTLTRGAVTPAESLSTEVEIESSTAQEAPAQSSVSLEQLEPLPKEDTRGRLKIAEGPLFSALKSLIHSPSQGLLSSSGDPRLQEHPFPELRDPAEASTGSTDVEHQPGGNTPEKNVFTTNSPISATDSALTLIATDDHTDERHWEYTSTGTEPPPPETSVPLLSSPGDEVETQLNQQLHILIPNEEGRRLISGIIDSTKKQCSEPRGHLACAKLISRIDRLMKLLRKQQEEKVAQAQWDTEQWKSKTYIKESSGVSSNQKTGGEPRDHTQEVPEHSYTMLILAIALMVTPVLLIIILCLIEICCHRTASGQDEEGSSSSDCRPRGRYSVEKDSQEGYSWFWQPLWGWYLTTPLNFFQQRSVANKLRQINSANQDEQFMWEVSDISVSE